MKTCDVCRAQYDDQLGVCPVCGYEPTTFYVGGAADAQAEAAQYRAQVLSSLSTELVCFAHRAEGDTLVPEEQCIPLSAQGTLQADGAPQWAGQPFCAEPESGTLDVTVRILRDGAPAATRRVTIQAPADHALLQVGILPEPDTLAARLTLKNDSRSSVSEPFGLLGE